MANPTNKMIRGYTVIELLFYIALFAILTIAVINSMITMTKSFREASIQGEIGGSGAIMERISREIRKAKDITSISTSDLVLSTTDDSGASKTLEFVLSGSDLQLWENGTLTGNLNTPNISVHRLSFTQITTTVSKAVMIDVAVFSDNDTLGRIFDFYNTITLRGKY